MKRDKDIIKKNEMIQLFMGYEYLTDIEKVKYVTSRDVGDPTEYLKRLNNDNIPSLKKKGCGSIDTLSMDNIRYSDYLNYERSLDDLYKVIVNIHDFFYKKHNVNVLFVINDLLNGTYGKRSEKKESLDFTVENLFERVYDFLNMYYFISDQKI